MPTISSDHFWQGYRSRYVLSVTCRLVTDLLGVPSADVRALIGRLDVGDALQLLQQQHPLPFMVEAQRGRETDLARLPEASPRHALISAFDNMCENDAHASHVLVFSVPGQGDWVLSDLNINVDKCERLSVRGMLVIRPWPDRNPLRVVSYRSFIKWWKSG